MTTWLAGWLCAAALADEPADLDVPDSDGPFVASGHRIAGFGGSHGIALGEQLVVGGDGGTSITTLEAKVALDAFTLRLRAPFAAYRTATGRDTDLGNLQLEGLYELEPVASLEHAFGVSLGVNLGTSAYTWATRADEVWPGTGVDLIWEVRTADLGATTLMGRTALGVHSTPGYAPLPSTWVRLQATGAVDQELSGAVGLVAEGTLAYWEIAPLELSGWLRADPVDSVRLRGGLVLPPFTWFGWEPAGRPGGVREATLALQAQASM